MCDFGGPNNLGRYDVNLVWDQGYKAFFGPKNLKFLHEELARRGYPNIRWNQLHPFMWDVYATTISTGFDPEKRTRGPPNLEKLNREFIEYFIPIAENQLCATRAYIMDKKHFRVLPQPISDSSKHQQVLLNTRWPDERDMPCNESYTGCTNSLYKTYDRNYYGYT